MTRELIIEMLNTCTTHREGQVIRCLLAMFDNRPEDCEGYAKMFISSDPEKI